MGLVIEPVNLDSDREELLALLRRNLTDLDHARRFEWFYLQNPAGKARSWFLYDEAKPLPVGAATVFPRFFWIDGSEEIGGQVGDFAVDAGYRSLGPAVRLQRATLELVDAGDLKFCYDCPPHERGMATFRRLGLAPLCRLTRFTRLERVDRLVDRVPGGAAIRAPLKLLGNGLLWVRSRTNIRSARIEIEVHQGPFGDEFDELERSSMRARTVVRSCRKARDLDWRYRGDPLHHYEVLVARQSNELVGFAVCSSGPDTIYLIHVEAASEPARLVLLDAVSEHARARDKSSVHTRMVSSSPEAVIVRRAGFIPREDADRIVVYPEVDNGGGWELGYADTIA